MNHRFLLAGLTALALTSASPAFAKVDEDSFADKLGQASELSLTLDPQAPAASQKQFLDWLQGLQGASKVSDRWEDLLERWNRRDDRGHGHGPSHPVPEPAAGLLMLAGIGLVALRRRRQP